MCVIQAPLIVHLHKGEGDTKNPKVQCVIVPLWEQLLQDTLHSSNDDNACVQKI